MAATSIHPIHTTEIKSIRYVMRDDKTDNGANIITYACGKTPEAIEKAFTEQRALLSDKGSALIYHIIQSFAPGEATMEQVKLAGQMLCDRLLKGQYQYVLAIHDDTEHLHNHIIFCKAIMRCCLIYTVYNFWHVQLQSNLFISINLIITFNTESDKKTKNSVDEFLEIQAKNGCKNEKTVKKQAFLPQKHRR